MWQLIVLLLLVPVHGKSLKDDILEDKVEKTIEDVSEKLSQIQKDLSLAYPAKNIAPTKDQASKKTVVKDEGTNDEDCPPTIHRCDLEGEPCFFSKNEGEEETPAPVASRVNIHDRIITERTSNYGKFISFSEDSDKVLVYETHPLPIKPVGYCGEMYYLVSGEGTKLKVEFIAGGYTETKLEAVEQERRHWRHMTKGLDPGNNGKEVVVRVTVTLGPKKEDNLVLMDDFQLTIGRCPEGEATTPSDLSCPFDNQNCEGWWFKGENPFRLMESSTPSLNTGPKSGATGKDDTYAYMEGTGRENQEGIMESREVYSEVPSCMRILMYMYGQNMGSLRIEAHYKDENGGVEKIELFSTGQRDDLWFEERIHLPPGQFKVYIIGKTGDGPKSDIAIDDIYFHAGECWDKEHKDRNSHIFCNMANKDNCHNFKLIHYWDCLIQKSSDIFEGQKERFMRLKQTCDPEIQTFTANLNFDLINVGPRGGCMYMKYRVVKGKRCDFLVQDEEGKVLKEFSDNEEDGHWQHKGITLNPTNRKHHVIVTAELNEKCEVVDVEYFYVKKTLCGHR